MSVDPLLFILTGVFFAGSSQEQIMELLCPAGNLPALKAAIDHGADAVYMGLKDDTNARHFAGLNFTEKKLQEAANYVHRHRRKLHIAINKIGRASCRE